MLAPAACSCELFFFFFNDTATTEIYTLSLHDALPIYHGRAVHREQRIERLGAHQRVIRLHQLDAHDERFDPAHQEEEERGRPVQDADPLVVDGRDPAPDAGLRRSVGGGGVVEYRGGHGGVRVTGARGGSPPAWRSPRS